MILAAVIVELLASYRRYTNRLVAIEYHQRVTVHPILSENAPTPHCIVDQQEDEDMQHYTANSTRKASMPFGILPRSPCDGFHSRLPLLHSTPCCPRHDGGSRCRPAGSTVHPRLRPSY